MVIREIKNREIWDGFLFSQASQVGLFPQSWEWLDFQEALRLRVWREGIFEEEGRLLGIAAIIKYPLPFGKNYFYCPRGPILEKDLSLEKQRQIFAAFKNHWRENQKGKFIFARFEPFANLVFEEKNLTRGYGKNIQVELSALHTHRGRSLLAGARPSFFKQPKQTLLLDLTREEEDILADMHEKTRYNIRLAGRKGVIVKNFQFSIFNFQLFFKLLKETAKRDKFRAHPAIYYEKILEVLGAETMKPSSNETMRVNLWLAYLDQEPIAGALVGYFGDTATYLHGASSYQHRAVMAPYLLHWEIIKNAQNQGFKWYDFWGIDEKKWPGVTRFKQGFFAEDILRKPECVSGRKLTYPGAFDLIFSRFWYKLYRLGRRIF